MEETKENEEQKEASAAPSKNNGLLWIAVVALLVIVGIAYLSGKGNNSSPPPKTAPAESETASDENVKIFDISAKPFEFSVKEIKVNKGDRVRINLTVTQGMHDWVVDEFNAKTEITQAGRSASVDFVADKTGTFEYYCSVPTHRQQGMVGKLIVE